MSQAEPTVKAPFRVARFFWIERQAADGTLTRVNFTVGKEISAREFYPVSWREMLRRGIIIPNDDAPELN